MRIKVTIIYDLTFVFPFAFFAVAFTMTSFFSFTVLACGSFFVLAAPLATP
jgi:hypothetical protein